MFTNEINTVATIKNSLKSDLEKKEKKRKKESTEYNFWWRGETMRYTETILKNDKWMEICK